MRKWSFSGPPEAFRAGAHDGVEFAWCTGGEVDYRIGGRNVTLSPGTVVMVPSLAEHANTMRGQLRGNAIVLSQELVADVAEQLGLVMPIEATLASSERLLALSRWLEEDAIANTSAVVTDALSTLVVAETLRAISRGQDRQLNERNDPRIRRAVDFIRAHATQTLSLEMLAHEVGMSRFHFCRSFRQTMGKSPYQFVQDERLARARAALQGGATVTEAALQSGFGDLSRFAKLYARTFGQLPSEAGRASARQPARSTARLTSSH